MPGSELTAYAAYREISAMFLGRMNQEKDQKKITELQEEWMKALRKFVEVYPRAEDTPDASALPGGRLGVLRSGSPGQAWYEQIYKNFPNHPLAEMVRFGVPGSSRSAKRWNWMDRASYRRQLQHLAVGAWQGGRGLLLGQLLHELLNEFARLKELQTAWASKGFEIVCATLMTGRPTARPSSLRMGPWASICSSRAPRAA